MGRGGAYVPKVEVEVGPGTCLAFSPRLLCSLDRLLFYFCSLFLSPQAFPFPGSACDTVVPRPEYLITNKFWDLGA